MTARYWILLGLAAAPAPAAEGFLYATKYLCSRATSAPLPYQDCIGDTCFDTEVSLYNLSGESAQLRISAVEAVPPDQSPPQNLGEALEITLEPDGAIRLGCGEIDRLALAQKFVRGQRKPIPNGFVRIESSVDVEATVIHSVFVNAEDLNTPDREMQIRSLEPRRIQQPEEPQP
ncbi:MAG: hypothetical protein GC160_13295 [Acidobacteria bacterium]|nr:hypothetical protein [Acidobacteriota bacterium]